MAEKHNSTEYICGIDEVGRGPLAGPVVASAVLLSSHHSIIGLGDSKSISEPKRNSLFPEILEKSVAHGFGWVWQDEIDKLNIHQASLIAMKRALEHLLEHLEQAKIPSEELPIVEFPVLVDGKHLPEISSSASNGTYRITETQAIIKGDSLIPAISAASILAKVTRDAWMRDYAQQEPEYGFEKHKGYPTRAHRRAIEKYGPSRIQRNSFRVTPP